MQFAGERLATSGRTEIRTAILTAQSHAPEHRDNIPLLATASQAARQLSDSGSTHYKSRYPDTQTAIPTRTDSWHLLSAAVPIDQGREIRPINTQSTRYIYFLRRIII